MPTSTAKDKRVYLLFFLAAAVMIVLAAVSFLAGRGTRRDLRVLLDEDVKICRMSRRVKKRLLEQRLRELSLYLPGREKQTQPEYLARLRRSLQETGRLVKRFNAAVQHNPHFNSDIRDNIDRFARHYRQYRDQRLTCLSPGATRRETRRCLKKHGAIYSVLSRELKAINITVTAVTEEMARQTRERARRWFLASAVLSPLGALAAVLLALLLYRKHRSLRRTEYTIRARENDLRITLDSIGDAVITTDTAGRVVKLNPIAEELTGWPLSEAAGQPLTDVFRIVNAQTRERADDPVANVLRTGRIVGLANHTLLLSRNGNEYQIADSASPIRDDEGQIRGVVLVFHDVTREYHLRETIRRNEEMFQNLMQAIPDMISVHDRDFNIVYSNWHGFGAVTEADRHLQTKCYHTYRGYDQVCPDCQARQVWETRHPFQTEAQLPDGTWYDLRVIPILNAAGECHQFVEWVRDITVRKQAEDALKKSEHTLRSLTDNATDYIFIKDSDLRYTFANRALEQLLRHPIDKILGKTPDEVFPPDTAQIVRDADNRTFAGETVNTTRKFTINGSDHYFHTVQTPLDVADGQVHTIMGIVRDISDLKRAEARLRTSEEKFRLMTEASADVIYKMDLATTHINYISPAVHAVFGYSPQEVMHANIRDIMPKDSYRKQAREMERDLRRGQTVSAPLQLDLYHKDGHIVPVEINATTIPNADGAPREVLGIVRDISARKAAEEELRKTRNYIVNIINSMPSILIGVTPDGTVTQWNWRAEQTTGLSAAEAVDRPLSEVIPRLAAEMSRVREAIRTRREQANTKRIRYEDGERHFEDISVYPLITNGIEGAVIRVDDTTEQVRLEEMMMQSEKMLSVGGLAAGMAHEINNPLGGMVQNAQNMERRLGDTALPANQRAADKSGISLEAMQRYIKERGIFRMLQAIRESGDRAAEIVDNMLSFARKSDAEYSGCDPKELMERTLKLAGTDYDMKKQYDFRNIQLVKEYAAPLPPVPGERGKLQQVLLNILRNGAEAMHDAQTPDPTFTLRLRTDTETDTVQIEIEDNGPGMDDKTQRRIFEPFFTTKPTDRGTGLGLSVSYFIITENHGGELKVDSEPGQGTRFTIILPLSEKDDT